MTYGLLGEHLSHSYSPLIHSMLGSYPYRLFAIPEEKLAAFLTGGEFDGLNVTIPYKKAGGRYPLRGQHRLRRVSVSIARAGVPCPGR